MLHTSQVETTPASQEKLRNWKNILYHINIVLSKSVSLAELVKQ